MTSEEDITIIKRMKEYLERTHASFLVAIEKARTDESISLHGQGVLAGPVIRVKESKGE
jgi:hypothetical protein